MQKWAQQPYIRQTEDRHNKPFDGEQQQFEI